MEETQNIYTYSLSRSLSHTHLHTHTHTHTHVHTHFNTATCSEAKKDIHSSAFPYPLSSCNLVTGLRLPFANQRLYSAINLIAGKQSFCVSEGRGLLIRPFSFFHNQMINLHKFKIKFFSLTMIITLIIATQITVSSE